MRAGVNVEVVFTHWCRILTQLCSLDSTEAATRLASLLLLSRLLLNLSDTLDSQGEDTRLTPDTDPPPRNLLRLAGDRGQGHRGALPQVAGGQDGGRHQVLYQS